MFHIFSEQLGEYIRNTTPRKICFTRKDLSIEDTTWRCKGMNFISQMFRTFLEIFGTFGNYI